MNKYTLISLLLVLCGTKSFTQNLVGKSIQNITIKDANAKTCNLPHLGEKVLVVFYTDPDAKDVNEPLSTAIKNRKFAIEKYQGIGISNSKDTWLPNAVIQYAAREKQKKYPNSIILIDENHTLSKAWSLDNSDNSGYVILIGKDKKIKYIRLIKSQDESKTIIKDVLRIIEDEIIL